MSSSKTIGQVANYKPLALHNMEELAARQRIIVPGGGIAFARNVDGEQKTSARERILELFTPEQWPERLHMLTLPGLQWRFERKLLGTREVGWMTTGRSPSRTYFTGCENDRALYHAAVAQMPGLHTSDSLLRQIKTFGFAEHAVKTRYASLFFANVDELMRAQCWDGGWDAAWLDYTGPLTVERLALIQQFYHRYVHHILIVTALKARWNRETSSAIRRAGGYVPWLCKHLRGEILHYIEYQDTSPMAQFAVRRFNWKPPLTNGKCGRQGIGEIQSAVATAAPGHRPCEHSMAHLPGAPTKIAVATLPLKPRGRMRPPRPARRMLKVQNFHAGRTYSERGRLAVIETQGVVATPAPRPSML